VKGQVVEVDQSSALQVETLGTNLATRGLQEQIESGDQSKETADTQQVNSSVEDENNEEDDDESSSDIDESSTIEVEDSPKVLHTQ